LRLIQSSIRSIFITTFTLARDHPVLALYSFIGFILFILAVDIWSVGIIFLSILTGRYPFFKALDDNMAIMQLISLFGSEPVRKAALKYGLITFLLTFYFTTGLINRTQLLSLVISITKYKFECYNHFFVQK
jgi:serine/threonine protein kinase